MQRRTCLTHLTRLAALAASPASLGLAAGAGITTLAGPAAAQTAAGPMKLVVPYPPGGPLDTIARALAVNAREALGGNVVVENKPGAGGNLGADLVAKAAPDGRTIVLGAVATHAINPWLYGKLPYDPQKDFAPITLIARVPNVLVLETEAADRMGINSVADLISYVQRNPGELNYGSGGNGSAGHLAGELLRTRAGLKYTHVPFSGAAAAQMALLGGQVHFNFDNLASAAANIRSGKLKPLAVTGAKRSYAMPELPTMAEAGLPGFAIDTWFGLFAPAKTPAATIDKLHDAYVLALRSTELRIVLTRLMAEPQGGTPAQLGELVASELVKYKALVASSGAKAE
jgi:tripartite-type tricarboxylate transporter receptor subunit TctC